VTSLGDRVEIWLVGYEEDKIVNVIPLWAHWLGSTLATDLDLFLEFACDIVGDQLHFLADETKVASILIAWDFMNTLTLPCVGDWVPDIRPRGRIRDVDSYVYRIDITCKTERVFFVKSVMWDFMLYDKDVISWTEEGEESPKADFLNYNWSDEHLLFRADITFTKYKGKVTYTKETIVDKL